MHCRPAYEQPKRVRVRVNRQLDRCGTEQLFGHSRLIGEIVIKSSPMTSRFWPMAVEALARLRGRTTTTSLPSIITWRWQARTLPAIGTERAPVSDIRFRML